MSDHLDLNLLRVVVTLGNTRSVARAHYVHPHILETFTDHHFEEYLKASRPVRAPLLDADERALESMLQTLFSSEFSQLQTESHAVAATRGG